MYPRHWLSHFQSSNCHQGNYLHDAKQTNTHVNFSTCCLSSIIARLGAFSFVAFRDHLCQCLSWQHKHKIPRKYLSVRLLGMWFSSLKRRVIKLRNEFKCFYFYRRPWYYLTSLVYWRCIFSLLIRIQNGPMLNLTQHRKIRKEFITLTLNMFCWKFLNSSAKYENANRRGWVTQVECLQVTSCWCPLIGTGSPFRSYPWQRFQEAFPRRRWRKCRAWSWQFFATCKPSYRQGCRRRPSRQSWS